MTQKPCPPGIYLEKTIIQKDRYTPVFTAALLKIARTWKQPKCHLQGWIKMWYVCTRGYYSALKGTKLCHLQRWRYAWRPSYRMSKSEIEKSCIIWILCGIQKNCTDEPICKAETDRCREQTYRF